MYLMAGAGIFVAMQTLLRDLQTVSPFAKACLSLVFILGTVILVFWLVFTNKVSFGALLLSLFALCLFIYGLLEITFAVLDRWAVRSDVLSDVVRYVLHSSTADFK